MKQGACLVTVTYTYCTTSVAVVPGGLQQGIANANIQCAFSDPRVPKRDLAMDVRGPGHPSMVCQEPHQRPRHRTLSLLAPASDDHGEVGESLGAGRYLPVVSKCQKEEPRRGSDSDRRYSNSSQGRGVRQRKDVMHDQKNITVL
jgi:hypothetical protein